MSWRVNMRDMRFFLLTVGALALVLHVLFLGVAIAQEADGEGDGGQDAETKALDSTATQWSFQFAYQSMTWKDGTLDSGETRTAGLDNYVQLRIVAPIPLEGFTILPRLTMRHYENVNNGESGFGNTEIFALMIPSSWDWGSGRFGIGPLVTLPGDKEVARDEWGYGFATALVNSSGKWFSWEISMAILLCQSLSFRPCCGGKLRSTLPGTVKSPPGAKMNGPVY